MTNHSLDGKYNSEADFVSNFLLPELRGYAASHKFDAEFHLEEPAGNGRADLTVRTDGKKLLVLEAKLDTDPWHPDAVREGHSYSLSGFPYFAVCNPRLMVVFEQTKYPFQSSLAIVYYEPRWTDYLFGLTVAPPVPRPLYRLLLEQGEIDTYGAKLYEELLEMDPHETEVMTSPAMFRLVAVSGPYGEFPWTMGTYVIMEEAMQARTTFEGNGFTVKLQKRIEGRWKDFDLDQGTL